MSEKWVREWRGWEAARSELLAAQDTKNQRYAVEDHNVKVDTDVSVQKQKGWARRLCALLCVWSNIKKEAELFQEAHRAGDVLAAIC